VGPQGSTGAQGPQGAAGSSGTGGAFPGSGGAAAGVQGTTTTGTYITALTGTGATAPISATVTVPASGNVMVVLTAGINPGSGNSYMSWISSGIGGINSRTCSGATGATQAICDSQALVRGGSTFVQDTAVYFVSGLTAGSTTFTLAYRSAGGTAGYMNRNLIVQPLP
jgi:hypothetical protein